MSAAVGGRNDYDASPLCGLSRTSEGLRQVRRLLSLACVHDGMNRADAAKGDGPAEPEGPGAAVQRSRARRAVRPPGPAAPDADAAPMAELAEIIEPGPLP